MTLWLIDPHDPLIFRDGKPFGPTPGAYAKSMPFPFPSTTTGGLRQLAGLNDEGVFIIPRQSLAGPKEKSLDDLRKLSVRGPLLVRLTADGHDIESHQWLLPAPSDALVLPVEGASEQCQIRPLTPIQLRENEVTDFTDKLMLIGLAEQSTNLKQHKKAPRYWDWPHFAQWLFEPESFDGQDCTFDVARLGHAGPIPELRVHITMNPETRTALDQHLFDTGGLEFTVMLHAEQVDDESEDDEDKETAKKVLSHAIKQLGEAQRLGLAVIVDDDARFPVRAGLSTLGGERRIVSWHQSQVELPSYPPELVEQICATHRCRLILLTPAYFTDGYIPSYLLERLEGVKPVLKAIKIDRPGVVSGWDMEKNNRRATHRLAPAGTVMFLSFEDEPDPSDIKRWIDAIWLQCVSDEEQYRRDGFGLAVLGSWPKNAETQAKESSES